MFYSVEVVGDITDAAQLAFVVTDNGSVYLGRSGHDALIRQTGLDRSDAVGGGWVFLKQGKITLFSGSYGRADPAVKGAVENALSRDLRLAD